MPSGMDQQSAALGSRRPGRAKPESSSPPRGSNSPSAFRLRPSAGGVPARPGAKPVGDGPGANRAATRKHKEF